MSPALSPDQTSSGYLQHVNLCSGVLWKRVTSTNSGMGSLLYRRRYFELSNIALTYFPTEKKTGVSKRGEYSVEHSLLVLSLGSQELSSAMDQSSGEA